MATKRDLRKILEGANKAPRDSFGGWTPEDGQKIAFKVTKATTKPDKHGLQSWTLMLTITKGDDKGKVARCYMGISEEWEFITQRLIDNMAAIGVDIGTLWENPEQACEMALGKTGVAVVKYGGNDPNDPIVNFTFEPSRTPAKKAGAKKRRPPVEDVSDDEDEEETAPPKKRAAKKASKKAAAKRKPKPKPEPEEEDDELDDEFEDDDVFDPDEEEDEEVEEEEEDEELDDEWDDEWEDDED